MKTYDANQKFNGIFQSHAININEEMRTKKEKKEAEKNNGISEKKWIDLGVLIHIYSANAL